MRGVVDDDGEVICLFFIGRRGVKYFCDNVAEALLDGLLKCVGFNVLLML